MRRTNVDFYSGSIIKNTVIYTVPIILSGILQLLFNAADLIVVGRFSDNGSISVGAVGATVSITNLVVNFFIGLSVGVCVTVAYGLGAQDNAGVQRSVHTAIPLGLVCGALMTAVGVLFSHSFLKMMGTPEDVIGLSTLYMQIYFCGAIPLLIYNFAAAILRAAGDTQGPLIYLTIAGILNVLLNLLFVIVFKMDVAGVALATIISQTLSATLAVIAIIKRTDACKFSFREMHFSFEPMKKIITIGLPAGIQSAMFSISNVLIQSSINSFGTIAVSGSAAAANLEGFVYTAMNSFSQTSMNFVGQNMGAKNYPRARQSVLASLTCVAVTGLVLGAVTYLFGEKLLGIYITDSPDAIIYGLERLLCVCLPYFLCGIMDVMTGSLRGLGLSTVPMLISVIGVCVFRVIWIYTVFSAFRTLTCLFLSYPISWMLTFAAETVAFIIVWKKLMKKLNNETVTEVQ